MLSKDLLMDTTAETHGKELPTLVNGGTTSSPDKNVPTVDAPKSISENGCSRVSQEPGYSHSFQPPKEVFFVHPLKKTPIIIKNSEANLRAKALFNSVIAEEDVIWTKKVDESVEDDLRFTLSQRPAQPSPPPEPSPFSSGLKRPHGSLKVVKDAFRTPETNTRKKRAAAGLFRPPRPLDNTTPIGIRSDYITPDSSSSVDDSLADSSTKTPQYPSSSAIRNKIDTVFGSDFGTSDSSGKRINCRSFSPAPASMSVLPAQQVPRSGLSVALSSGSCDSGHGSAFGSANSHCSLIISSPMAAGFTQSEMDDIASLTMDCFTDENSFSELLPPPSPEKNPVSLAFPECSALRNVTSSNAKHLTASDVRDIEEISQISFAGLFDEF